MTTKRNILTATLAFAFLAGMGTLPTATADLSNECKSYFPDLTDNEAQPVILPTAASPVLAGVLTTENTRQAFLVSAPSDPTANVGIKDWKAQLFQAAYLPGAADAKANVAFHVYPVTATTEGTPDVFCGGEIMPDGSGVVTLNVKTDSDNGDGILYVVTVEALSGAFPHGTDAAVGFAVSLMPEPVINP